MENKDWPADITLLLREIMGPERKTNITVKVCKIASKKIKVLLRKIKISRSEIKDTLKETKGHQRKLRWH